MPRAHRARPFLRRSDRRPRHHDEAGKPASNSLAARKSASTSRSFSGGRLESGRPGRPRHRHPLFRNSGETSPCSRRRTWRSPGTSQRRDVQSRRPIDSLVAIKERSVGPLGHPTRPVQAPSRLSIATAMSPRSTCCQSSPRRNSRRSLRPAGSAREVGPRENCTRWFARRGSKSNRPAQKSGI